MLTQEYSRNIYQNILCQSLNNPDFYLRIAAILDNDPYFFPGHLEMLWNAEERADRYTYNKILDNALHKIGQLFTQSVVRNHFLEHSTELEIAALNEVLDTALKNKQYSYVQKLLFKLQKSISTSTLAPRIKSSPTESLHMRLVKTIDTNELKAEITNANEYWWQVDTKRRETILHHQHTWSIILRNRENRTADYSPEDGIHESSPTQLAGRFPQIHLTILKIAEDLEIALGRVAIVKMAPHTQAYRHFDSEIHLRNRDRYHLVLQCGELNLLESGNDKINAQEGELWYFDNKAMHRAHNKSHKHRIHVIFDGYPRNLLPT